jgi:hypothetical protein
MSAMLATVLSIIAIALSALALGVQFGQLVVSGPVVRVAGIWIRWSPVKVDGPLEKRVEVEVTASNTGRSAITVLRVGVGVRRRLRRGIIWIEPDTESSDELPHRLEPGTSATWWIPLDDSASRMLFNDAKPGGKKLAIVRLPNDKTRTGPIHEVSLSRPLRSGELIYAGEDADTAGQQDASDAAG